MPRRLFIGDLHGCLRELNLLLKAFGFIPGQDRLYSVGDILGKGPEVLGTLERLRELQAGIVRGNHDQFLIKAMDSSKKKLSPKNLAYLHSLGPNPETWIEYIRSWPFYIEWEDLILVHAGLEPRKATLAEMSPEILIKIRTWDGKGEVLKHVDHPAWYECVEPKKTVVFGHWAERGLIDQPRFKGLDTGCVYGGKLTGWCPEENRFIQVPALKAYALIQPKP